MKLHIISDLHEEFGPFTMPQVDRDVLVLAGDRHTNLKTAPLLEKACKDAPVIFVLGNHEYYGHDFDHVLHYWKDLEMDNLFVLENRTVVIDGTRFVGATLWSDMGNRDPRTLVVARNEMSDYSVIEKDGRHLRPEDTLTCFNQSLAFLNAELQKTFDGPTVVITHHLPSYKSIAPRFEGDTLNGAYASELDDLILKYEPVIWIHGHTHVSFDYCIGKTRVLCNPRGYFGVEENAKFDPNLVIEI
jgi:Icc-related predicted phosphoesterase